MNVSFIIGLSIDISRTDGIILSAPLSVPSRRFRFSIIIYGQRYSRSSGFIQVFGLVVVVVSGDIEDVPLWVAVTSPSFP
jgi:hypothetical protein